MPTQLQLNFADYYDRHADAYLEMRQAGLLYFNTAIEIPSVMSYLGSKSLKLEGTKVLDVGSGLGTYSELLAKSGALVTAIDISKRMMEITRESTKGLGVECLNEDLFEHSGNYQLIVAGFMLGYFQNLEAAFTHLKTLTSRGSTVLISSVHPFKRSFSGDKSKICRYFGRHDYASDFLDAAEPLGLTRWIIEEVCEAAYNSKFAVDRILEPRPAISYQEYGSKELYEHYSHHPSVIVYVLRRR